MKLTNRIFLILFLFFLSSCSLFESGKQNALQPKRIFFITIDTLRADHLSQFGYFEETAPFLRNLADTGVTFTSAYSQVSHTAPSHASMFTGLYPFQHGILRNHEVLSEKAKAVEDILPSKNVELAAFPSVVFLDGKVGMPKSPVSLNLEDRAKGGGRRRWWINAGEVFDNALKWITAKKSNDKFFLWAHVYDVHQWAGWGNLPKEYREQAESKDSSELVSFVQKEHGIPLEYWKSEEKLKRAIIGYDARLKYVDDQLKRFYNEMKQKGLTKNSLWIITSDHGEGLGNHHFEGHGEYIYQEQLHVPLIIHSPDGPVSKASIIPDLVRLVDLFPTFVELFGAEISHKIEGASLLPLLEGKKRPEVIYSFAQRRPKDNKSFRKTWEDGLVYSLHDEFYKLIFHSESEDEFFDLKEDPGELLSTPTDSLKNNYDEELKETLSRKTDIENSGEQDLNKEQIEELKSLGYL